MRNQNTSNKILGSNIEHSAILIDNQGGRKQDIANKNDESVTSLDDEKLENFKDLAEKYLLEVVDDLPAKNMAECKIFFEIFRQLRNRTMFELIKEVDILSVKVKEYEKLELKSRPNANKNYNDFVFLKLSTQ